MFGFILRNDGKREEMRKIALLAHLIWNVKKKYPIDYIFLNKL